MLKCIWTIMTIYSFVEGFWLYREGNHALSVGLALVCAFCACELVREITGRKYMFMRLRKVDRLSGKSFEKYLAVHFRRIGYKVKLTGSSNDYGADLLLKRGGKTTVVQAKRYDRNVGIGAVQEVTGAMSYYQADRAMVVTNQYFTRNAENLAGQTGVRLWGRKELKRYFHAKD
ncbi:MAG: restriction endonuclease [Eubacterium sp.]|nr:restriction endonuclease [Eubacterium sp.]